MGLQNVEWVIVDEVDILFGNSSFFLILLSMTDETDNAHPRSRLSGNHSSALSRYRRGKPVPYTQDLLPPSPETSTTFTLVQNTPILYLINLILTTATIPPSHATYLDAYHPALTRLASPKLHRLPSTMKTEYEGWTGGNKDADVERRIRKVWADDSIRSDFNIQWQAIKNPDLLQQGNQGSKPRVFPRGQGDPQRSVDKGWQCQEHSSFPSPPRSLLAVLRLCDLIKETGVPMSCSGYGSVFGNAEHVNVNKIFVSAAGRP